MIEQAKKQYPKLSFAVMNAMALEYPQNTFDAVLFSFNGIDYLYPEQSREKALQEIHRVLKPGALFAYSSHNGWMISVRKSRIREWIYNFIQGKAFARYRYDYRPFGNLLTFFGSPSYHKKTLKRQGFEFVANYGGKKYRSVFFSTFLDPYIYYLFRKQ